MGIGEALALSYSESGCAIQTCLLEKRRAPADWFSPPVRGKQRPQGDSRPHWPE